MELEVYLNSVKKHWDDPNWWRRVAGQFVVEKSVVKPYFQYVSDYEGIDVMGEDWDNLVVLDACRYDMFAEQNTIEGRLESRYSRGSNTPEWLRENFAGRTFEDTVYVTANPQITVRLPENPFHDVVNVWTDHWDDDLNTVHPAVMAEETAKAAERYPDKRVIAHFVQPHYPFIGETGRKVIGQQAGMELSKRMADGANAEQDDEHVWDKLKRGAIDVETVWTAYRENLDLALPHVETLLDSLPGTTVVTSDHGNLLGERPTPCPVPMGMYGHPEGVYTDHLVKVPWLVVEGTERKEVVAEAAVEGERVTAEETQERLQDLGYL
ncbi:hypothetical protein [Halomarina ordinaria]|uniref:Sulfatase-like hydrolase/transferase n=1 Tax=Halomarina ordinaria TaxID=3033939 RepID=A0ABD5UE83_9EURY|nr:hypothetical protein [Halomarina sp. PSRA2]